MAAKFTVSYEGAGATLYVVVRRISDGYVWNGTTSEVWANGNIGTYDIPLADQGGDLYSVNVPTTLPTGIDYEAIYYKQLAGAPAITDDLLTRQAFTWRGDIEIDPLGADADWYWSDQNSLERTAGSLNVSIISDYDSNDTANTDAIQQAGERSDAVIDLRFRKKGATTPTKGVTATYDQILGTASDFITLDILMGARRIISNVQDDRIGIQIRAQMLHWMKQVDEIADLLSDSEPGTFEEVSITDSTEDALAEWCDENGCVL